MKRSLPLAFSLLLPALAAGQEITPNENLVVDGVPKIPAGVAESVGRYTDFRSANLFDWHPTKREMLISTRFGDTNQAHWVKAPGADRRQITFFSDTVRSARFPRHSTGFFVFAKDKGGDEFSQIYRYDLDSGKVTLLTDGGRSQNGIGPFSHAGDRLAYGSTARNGTDRDLYVMDPKDPKSARLVLQVTGGGWAVSDWSPDDKTLLVREYVSVSESYVHLLDVASGTTKLLTPKGGAEQISYQGGVFSADGKGIYVTTDKGSEFQRLTYIDIATGQHTALTPKIDWDVDDFALSDDGKTIAFATNENGISTLHLLNTATRTERPAPRLGVVVINNLRWHPNSRDLAVVFTSATAPNDVYSVDTTMGKVERWTESETGGMPTSSFAHAELVQWPSFDGRTISGFLYKASSTFTGKRPVLISIHGGPEGQSRPSFLGRSAYYTDELGVTVIAPNVRGSTGFGKSFATLDNGIKREDSVKDIGALLDWIKTRPDLDSERVMISGGSYGGYMTLASATHFSDRVRCFVDVVGISNFVSFLEHTEAYRRDLRRVEYGDERDPKMRAFLESISPRASATKITKPLFVIQGRNDPRVPYTESEEMVATVKKNGTPVWFLMAKDEGHGFGKKKNADFQFFATAEFMKQHLLN
jgi:dipeptidyl aminopeptidase/acylaminoacyl peptidase